MWIESRDDINKIFKDQKTDFYLDGLSLYKNNSLISDGFILVNSVNLHFYDHSKEAIFHCIYFQKDIPPLKVPHIQIKWFAFDEETSFYDIDFSEIDLNDNETLILCTDGLSNFVTNNEMIDDIKDGQYYAFADRLVKRANKNGGGDNITVVAIAN